jgi:hypothetical protein
MIGALFHDGIVRFIYSAAVITLMIMVCSACAGSTVPSDSQPAGEDCIGEVSRRIREAPEKEYLQTLDGQEIRLQEFFSQCRDRAPECVLFEKFYHWDNEIRQEVSRSDKGTVEHRIRAYYNPLSICQPQRVHPGRTHGDVAEFYDTGGRFMGLAVYMGQGRYFLLHYSGYGN